MGSESELRDFVQLYTSHEVRLRALALSLLPQLEDANDVLQETSVVLWEKFSQYAAGTSFFAWAAAIMQRKAKEFRRTRSRHTHLFSDDVLQQIAAEAVALSEFMVERERALHQCIAKLGLKHRNMLRLRYEKGSSIKGISAALGRTEGSVRQGLARIRKFLSDCVARHMAAEGTA